MAEAEKEKEMKLSKEAEQANGQQRLTVKRERRAGQKKEQQKSAEQKAKKKMNVLTQGEVRR